MLSFDGISCEFLYFNIVCIILNNWCVCYVISLFKNKEVFQCSQHQGSI